MHTRPRTVVSTDVVDFPGHSCRGERVTVSEVTWKERKKNKKKANAFTSRRRTASRRDRDKTVLGIYK